MTQRFYSNGKLLISGEYVVLDGVTAFALPTKFGQAMEVTPIAEPLLRWKAYTVEDALWMDVELTMAEVLTAELAQFTEMEGALVKMLRRAHELNNTVLSQGVGFEVTNFLTFPRLWGLGTSSTWINNIAQWFNVNGFQLLADAFGGSGYDIACAQSNQPILYQRTSVLNPRVEEVKFTPDFQQNLYFVYLNQKQNSRTAIENYRKNKHFVNDYGLRLEQITHELVAAKYLNSFSQLLEEHEQLMAKVLEEQTVKERLFSDFQGVVKSLGAWGGDFVLVASVTDPTSYFKSKGYDIIVPYQDMIL